ncbi:MAG: hypothetical protein BGO04_07320 [Microbacterium sp. 70-38]|nr:MAG: hypothetical protein BGO04_07320 [Microbacterium sp. 70-38]
MSYILRDPDAEVQVVGDARFDGQHVVELSAVRTADGIRATGAVTLRAHGGALSVGLVGVRIEGDSLWISPPADGEPPTGLRLVVLRAVPGADGEYDALLAPEADQMFLYNYVPGTDFGRVTVRPGSRP